MEQLSFASNRSLIDRAFAQLGITPALKIKPDLLQEIIKEDMFLEKFPPLQPKLYELLKSEISFAPMFDSIISGILNRHPAIVDFLCHAVKNNLFAEASGIFPQIERMIHHIFLLEVLVQEMKSLNFTIQLYNFFDEMKQDQGVRTTWIGEFFDVHKITKSFFQAAKMVTVDKKTIAQYIDFRSRKNLTEKDLKAKNRGLYLNIREARLADLLGGNKSNARVASILARSPVKKIHVRGNDEYGAVAQEFATGWPSLYETWNLAFVLGNLTDLQIILPKLVIPSVINAEPDEYLYYRGISLWLTTNFVLQKKLHGMKSATIHPQFKKIAEIWGKINLAHAKKFAEVHSIKELEDASTTSSSSS